jgi:hypothetical protein
VEIEAENFLMVSFDKTFLHQVQHIFVKGILEVVLKLQEVLTASFEVFLPFFLAIFVFLREF